MIHLRCLPAILTSLLLTLASGCASRVNPEVYAKCEGAQQAFDAAQSPDDFVRVAAMYQEILDSGLKSGVIFYNQGNAFMRAGQKGRAVAAYRQALRYRPLDPQLQANLRVALGGKPQEPPLAERILFWQNWISYPAKFQITLASALCLFALAVVRLFWNSPLIRYPLWLAAMATLAMLVSAGYDYARYELEERGVVIRPEIVARKGDSARFEPAFTQPLGESAEFAVIERRNGWIRIRLPNASEAWIQESAAVTF